MRLGVLVALGGCGRFGFDSGGDSSVPQLLHSSPADGDDITPAIISDLPAVPAADSILVAIVVRGSESGAISVSGGMSTWTQLFSAMDCGGSHYIFVGTGSPVGTSVRATGISTNWRLQVTEWSGLSGAVGASATIGGSSPIVTSGSLRAGAGSVALGMAFDSSGSPPLAGPTNQFTALPSHIAFPSLIAAFRITGEAGELDTAWTFSTATCWIGGIVELLPL